MIWKDSKEMIRKTTCTIGFIFFAAVLFSQSASYIFHNKGQKDGLSANYCYSILKDSRGMMWIGTHNGLNRFDGYHFNNFYSGHDSNSFINNIILDLCEDKEGNIWGATGSGIFCYQYQQNKFKNYIPPGYDYARAVQNIMCDKNGNIWATGLWTILKLNKKKNIFEELGPLTNKKDSLSFYSVRQNGMVEDPSGKGIWMTTRMGLHYYDIAKNKFYSYKNMPGDSLFTRRSVSALSLSCFGYFWMFDNTSRAIIAFDPATHRIINKIDIQPIIPYAYGQSVFEDNNHKLWFSSWNNKMAVIDYRKNTFTLLSYKRDNPFTIGGDNFWGFWEDEDNTIWLGTAGGLSVCNYSKNIYTIYPISENIKEFSEGHLSAFNIDPRDSSLWITTEVNVSLAHYFPETGKYVFYDFNKAEKNREGQMPSFVYNVLFLENKPYVSTQTGIWLVDEVSHKLIPYEKIFKGFPYIHYYYFVQNGEFVWYTTSKGFIKWNRNTDEAKLVSFSKTILPDSQYFIYGVPHFDNKKNAWFIPAFGWLAHINERDEIDTHFYIRDKPRELSSYITGSQFDSKNKFWMASVSAGIYRFDPETKEIKLFDQIEGIGTTPGTLVIDKQDRIWVISLQKIAVFNQETGDVNTYFIPLNDNTSDYNTLFQIGLDSSVYVTLNKSIAKFIPSRLEIKPIISPPLISMIKIVGKERMINKESSIYLQPNENSLEFNFGSLINNDTYPYSFQYKLENFDKNWITAGKTTQALYSNLESGKYVFRLKVVSKNKVWETPERIITIAIRTPFYRAPWFWTMISGLFLIALIFFYRYRLNKQKQILTLETKAQQLEKDKTMVMYESLKQQLNPHFLFNSLTSLSGLIETDQQLAGNFLEQMSGIYRYILKNGDKETVSLREEIEFVQLYINLQQTRFKKGLIVNINVPDEYMDHKIAPVTLQNLVENAIKHNIIDVSTPLIIDIFIDHDYLVARNNLQRKNMVETSNKKGLTQFVSLYRYLSDLPVTIEESEKFFQIKIPLI
ncbi:MAG: histidine kinase [Bacteroidota bacterium]